MNITELLKEDHREAESLIAELEGGNSSNETFGKLKNALTLHTQIEEEIFYPALENFDETEDLIDEAYQEHSDVDQLLEDMSATEVGSEDFQELLTQLKESINHHVEEEENQLFPLSERLLGAERLDEMGSEIENMKSSSTMTQTTGM
jgi:hemerythrin-like domain-containing protein